jgi:glyoxylase-like metal-dependent hydrolase (beta-lactamase superfamily II)
MKTLITTLLLSSIALVSMAQENINKYEGKGFALYTLNERSGTGNSSILVGATDAMKQATMPDGTYPNAINCFLLVMPKYKILFDAGTSSEILLKNLKDAGFTTDDINVVMITHCHGDHIGGLINNGIATFPKAQVYLAKAEDNYWKTKGNKTFDEMKKLYADKIIIFEPKSITKPFSNEFFSYVDRHDNLYGIEAIEAYGHTPGHTIFLINTQYNNETDNLLIWGDLTHASAIQMVYPEVAVTYDTDPKQAIASRKKVLDYISKNKIPAVGMHVPFPGIVK